MAVIHQTTKLDYALNQLGTEIVSGVLPAGATFTLATICERFDISRTVAREVMRALEQLNLVKSSRRIGLKVLPRSHWSVFDEAIIEWRLRTPGERDHQLRSLTSLRLAVEPQAARGMAHHGTDEQIEQLLELSNRLHNLGAAGRANSMEFLKADVDFHTLILTCSGNEMFAALAPTVTTVLIGRTELGIQPHHLPETVLTGHDALAHAIAVRNPDRAERCARMLLDEVRDALDLT
ncbi:FadR/GntR family transcriptional regulator [Corynebacterium aquilae]|uniref:Transcriptional regulator n=1 Tax=Corynebacterium aquilae DSM 44791 TaxID=1431546 RepID=A0A1L7CHM8_9CORY|nr:FCD domain-containing protein [Corynebacterium aquilae]APT85361.1 transcriptional regulator [Corynebacterium aquilae DSM 44791]